MARSGNRWCFALASDDLPPDDEPRQIVIGDMGDGISVDPSTGAVKIEDPETGSIEIDFDPPDENEDDDDPSKSNFDRNLAEKVDDGELARISSEILRMVEADDQSRQQWLETRAKGIDLLGFRIEEARSESGASTAPLEGMSTVRHPLLAEAVIRFQSNASAELLPAAGPVKVRDDTPPKPSETPPDPSAALGLPPGLPMAGAPGGQSVPDKSDLAQALETDFNHYLLSVDRGYVADTRRMLFWVGYGGCAFKKVYYDPVKRMPVSRSIDAIDLIVDNAANDLDDAGRITHRILMRPSVLRRMQLAGIYRDKKIGTHRPTFEPNAVEQKEGQTVGYMATPQRPEDHPYTIYEVYLELNLKGYEHKENGKETGLALPYRVTIEKESGDVLEIRRNWAEDDENYMPKKVFVKYPFIPAMGFYDTGLLHLLGNTARALTGAWREVLDAGMFASFPGFIYAKTGARQMSNQFRIPPGGGFGLEIPAQRGIHDVIMPLPYKEPSQALIAMSEMVETTAQRVGGTSETQVAEGKQDAPVGTTLALIEQATKMMGAVHKGLHAAQAEEFQLLKDCFKKDPEAFWRYNRRPAASWERTVFLQALEDYDLVPAADPNTPSHMHRLMKCVAIKQLQQANMGLYDGKAVDTLILHMIGISDPERLFAPPQPAMPPAIPPDPNKMAELQQRDKEHQGEMQQSGAELAAKGQERTLDHQARMAEIAAQAQDKQRDRESREKIEMMRFRAQQQKDQVQMAMQQHMNQQKLEQQQQMHQQELQHNQQQHQQTMEQSHMQSQMQAQQNQQMHHDKLQMAQQQGDQKAAMQEKAMQQKQEMAAQQPAAKPENTE